MNNEQYDIIIIGAGHAGIEAGLAAARLGCNTVIFTMNLDAIGNLPCNPSIGGTAKGHLVREIDALGGEMGKAADATLLQSRMLNRSKGPAVHSLRAQVDRRQYGTYMKAVLERQNFLSIKQVEIIQLNRTEDNEWECVTRLNTIYKAKAVIIATGTFLNGKIYVGSTSYSGGPDNMFAALELSDSLNKLGLPLRRFKTGTPARANSRSINYDVLEVQEGEDPVVPFSFETTEKLTNKIHCHLAWTNLETAEIIKRNLHRSPMYSGDIDGVGPRYCPSIEDKIVRFASKPRHQIFVEPCGLDTAEVYLQGMSSSLPEDVQIELYRSVVGFEQLEIMRHAYAIEYDCVDPTAMLPTLEFKVASGLYGAGQFNGSSGYEEAAAQGVVAGINAARKIKGEEPFVLKRSSSYIGTLIDDLVTKGCTDPYRMMTSRSEYRLLLRQDNADVRLTPLAIEIGLASDQRRNAFYAKQACVAEEIKRINTTFLQPSEQLNAKIVSRETSEITVPIKIIDLIKRPQISYTDLTEFDTTRPTYSPEVFEHVEISIKYEGYIAKQLEQIARQEKTEAITLQQGTDYAKVTGLSLEAIEKLNKVQPLNLGQAGRISGITPADITVLQIWQAKLRREQA